MESTCQKCGKTTEGNSYSIYFGKIKQENAKIIYTDLGSEKVFLCKSCALSERHTINWVLLVCLLMVVLFFGFLFYSAVSRVEPGEYGTVVGLGLFILILIAAMVWFIRDLIKRQPKLIDGENVAAAMRVKALMAKGYNVWPGRSFEKLAASIPQLKSFETLSNFEDLNIVSQKDLDAIQEYVHYLALEWWKTSEYEAAATCDVCNGPVLRDTGFLIGTFLYCDSCGPKQFGREGLMYLRNDPNFFGTGVLQKARAFVATKSS